MGFDPILPRTRVEAMAEQGHWPDTLVVDWLDAVVKTAPEREAILDHNSMTGESTRLSYGALQRRVDRIALGLADFGIGAGDVVAFQLPNWWQFTALHLACVRIGAVSNPLMPIFRERELRHMLAFGEAKAVVVPAEFRGVDHLAMIEGLRGDLPGLDHVWAVGGSGAASFEDALLVPEGDDAAVAGLFAERRPGPNDVTELLYTSGTTGEPKGVMHTANTLFANVLRYIERVGLTRDDVVMMSSPMAHQTGFLYGALMPIVLGTRVVLQDIWDPNAAVEIIAREKVTYTMASTPFLADLTDAPAVDDHDISSLHTFLTAGAPIPRVLVERATQRLDIAVLSAWGMSENGAVTITRPGDPPEKVFGTDGVALPGMEVRVVDWDGNPVPAGAEGRLQVRGASSFVGYYKRPERYDTDADGWFETGDLAWMDADGYIRITGRSKDVIIRGGENVPVVEVEELLYRHPAVLDCAIVAMPDERLGERGCAFVTLRPGESLDFEGMLAYLRDQKIAKNYLPERLEIVPDMPRTASGKIQKFRLREAAEKLTV